MEHPDHHSAFAVRYQVIQKLEVYKNKEDIHGGPGYYPVEEVVETFYKELRPNEVASTISRVARGELK